MTQCSGDYGPPIVDFRGLYRGDYVAIPFLSEEMDDPDADPNDPDTVWNPRDLSGGTFECKIRVGSAYGDEWGTAPTISASGAASGEYTMPLAASLTETAVPGMEYVYDIEYTEDGEPETLVRGVLTFEADVTYG